MTSDTSQLQALEIISPKRAQGGQSKWNECFPYYAGFPESFAEKIIRTSGISADALIFDPWNGSGTTTYAAARLGYNSRGIDLNPVMVLIAKARALPPSEADSIFPQAKSIAKDIKRLVTRVDANDPLCQWFATDAIRILRGLERRVSLRLTDETKTEGGTKFNKTSCFAATFYVILFSICKTFATRFKSSNPTWLRVPKADEAKSAPSADEIVQAFLYQSLRMAKSLSIGASTHRESATTEILVGNTTELTQSCLADLIITHARA